MIKYFFALGVSLALVGCDSKKLELNSTPLVMSVRFKVENASPQYIEKYFTSPFVMALEAAPHVTDTHALAITNSATITVFFEDGIKFSEGEDIIVSASKDAKFPKKVNLKEFAELCGDDLTKGHLMHIAKLKGINPALVLDRVITVTADLPENLMPPGAFDSMFPDECNSSSEIPLYVLED